MHVYKKLLVVVLLISLTGLGFTQNQRLKILSWNIFMIPPTIFKSCQAERVILLSDAVKKWDADVIIFQEAFQKKSRDQIWERIKDQYPYESGVTKPGFFKTHSGVWIVSKYPITRQESITYQVKKGSDRFAKKGATFIEVNMNGKKFQVIGTHVQSGSAYQAVRDLQFKQLVDELANKYMDFNIPQFIGGDLNTDHKFTEDVKRMFSILDVLEIQHTGEPFSWNGKENTLGAKFFGTQQEILDYILLRKQHQGIAIIVSEIIYSPLTAEPVCKSEFNAMSDHYPVMAEIELR